jgi:glycosyltransferase involved in cell wall biosynthesis
MKSVSVLVVTFNHEKCIERCLESIASQKFSNFEIVVGIDKSNDNTLEIVKQFSKKSEVPIKIIAQEERVGPYNNFVDVNKSCEGKYLAICDGDDYWTDMNKLSKQFKFMEDSPNLIVSFHDSNLVNSDGDLINILPIEKHKYRKYSQSYLIENESFMPSSSLMFKNICLKEFNNHFFELNYIVDLPLIIYLLEFGEIGYLEGNMSNYVIGSNQNSWSSNSTSLKNIEAVRMFELINIYTKNEYKDVILKKIFRNLINIFLFEITRGEITIAGTALKRLKSDDFQSLKINRLVLLRILLVFRKILGIWSAEILFKIFIRFGILNYE